MTLCECWLLLVARCSLGRTMAQLVCGEAVERYLPYLYCERVQGVAMFLEPMARRCQMTISLLCLHQQTSWTEYARSVVNEEKCICDVIQTKCACTSDIIHAPD